MSTEKQTPPDDYKNLIDLLAVFSEAKQRLAVLQTEIDAEFTGIVDEHRKDYAELQGIVTDTEAVIVGIAERHPEWFTAKRSVKTPYGTVKVTSTTKLEVPNEEASILLIERHPEASDQLLRTRKELNIEALENLTDAELKAFRIRRVRSESVSVKEASVDLGKAVKAAVAKEQAA